MNCSKMARNSIMEKRENEIKDRYGKEAIVIRFKKVWFACNPPENGYPYYGVTQTGQAFNAISIADAEKKIGIL